MTISLLNMVLYSKQKLLKMFIISGAGIAGYTIVGLPVFGSKREKYLSEVKHDASIITKDYVRNSSILINLAKVKPFFWTSLNFN